MTKLEDYFRFHPIKSKKVLLVDDEAEIIWILRKIIRDAGHKPICATSGKEGLEKFKRSRNLDIAIIDLMLDDENGLTFIRKAKAVNDKVKFVIISAFGTSDTESKARRLGVRHFFHKPLRVERLLETINKDCL